MSTCAELEPSALLTEEDNANINSFLETLNASDWKVSSQDSSTGFMVSWKHDESFPVIYVKGMVPINVPTSAVVDFVTNDNHFEKFMKTCDSMCKSCKVLEVKDAKHTVKHAKFKLPSPLWDRDFVWAELCTMLPDGSCLSSGTSVEHKDCPPESGNFFNAVRGLISCSGYYVTPAEGDTCVVQYLVQCDPCGMIPAAAVNLLATDQAQNVLRLKKHLETKA